MLLLGRFVLPRLFAQAARTKSPELFLSVSLLVVITASLATTAVGLSPIVGALIAGILIAETEYRGEVEVMTAPFRGLGLGIFLITVGMSIDLGFIAGHWPQLLMALVGVMVAKTVVTALFLRWGGRRQAVAAEASLLMASPSETTLIVLDRGGRRRPDRRRDRRLLADRHRHGPDADAAARADRARRGRAGSRSAARRASPTSARPARRRAR